MSEIWKLPSAEKIYESMTAVADNRVNVISSTTGKVWSSSGNKFYDITYDSGNSAIMSNDNSSYWKGEMGYPAIAFLMAIDVIEYDGDIAKLLANVSWKDINQKHKNNFKIFVDNYLKNYRTPLTFVICDYIGYHN